LSRLPEKNGSRAKNLALVRLLPVRLRRPFDADSIGNEKSHRRPVA